MTASRLVPVHPGKPLALVDNPESNALRRCEKANQVLVVGSLHPVDAMTSPFGRLIPAAIRQAQYLPHVFVASRPLAVGLCLSLSVLLFHLSPLG